MKSAGKIHQPDDRFKNVSNFSTFAVMNTRPKKDTSGMSMKERYPMTISQQLYDAWQIMRRKGDPAKIQKETTICRPIIDRALNYGNVKDEFVERKISEYFQERFDKQEKKGDKLLKIAFTQ